MTITLDEQTWTDAGHLPEADDSGFGEIRLVKNPGGDQAVAKFIPHGSSNRPTARELILTAMAGTKGARNVVPVLDMGEHEGKWVLVMPRAEMSLARHIAVAGPLGAEEAIRILQDIATALADLQELAVHRDLKPANVLKFGETWCLTDFGLARAVDEATGSATWKGHGTKEYAAPEIFQMGHATPATDIYAFGVIAFELLEGRLPFTGPDFATAHMRLAPPALKAESAYLKEIVTRCLSKDPALRPSPSRVLELLARALQAPAGPGAMALAAVNATVIEKEAADQAAAATAEAEQRTQSARFDVARQALDDLAERFIEYLEASASAVRITENKTDGASLFYAQLENGRLELARPRESRPWTGPFDVICHANIAVRTDLRDSTGYEGRSHSLWYCDAQEEGDFAWFETAFMTNAYGGSRSRTFDPYALAPPEAGVALSNVVGSDQLARPFEEVDHVAPGAFLDAWGKRFADAAAGKLQRPLIMPEKRVEGSYRTRLR